MSIRFLRYFPLFLFLLAASCRTPVQAPPTRNALQNRVLRSQSAVSWQAVVKDQHEKIFKAHDTNRSGFIEPNEISHAPVTFKRLDINSDQRLSLKEALPTAKQQQNTAAYLEKELGAMGRNTSKAELESIPTPGEIQRFERELENASHSYKDLDRPPVLLVPGYGEPSWYFMYGLYRQLKKAGYQVEGINLFPNFAPAEEQAVKVKARIEDMKARYGVEKVELVVHSYGGLISRYYIQEMGGTESVRNLITIATPHHGTYVAYLGPGASSDQLKYNSPWIQELNANGYAYPPVRYTSIWSNVDEIVLPPRSAIMPESEVHEVRWTGHLTIMFSRRTYRHMLSALARP